MDTKYKKNKNVTIGICFLLALMVSGILPANELSIDPDHTGAAKEEKPLLTKSNAANMTANGDGCDKSAIENYHERAVDTFHYRFSQGLCAASRWLDSAFTKNYDHLNYDANSTLRIVGSQNFQEHVKNKSELGVTGKVHLPFIEEKLSLVFSSDDTRDSSRNSELTRGFSEERRSLSAGLQLLKEKGGFEQSVRVGTHSGLKGRVLFRVRKKKQISHLWLWRITESVDWRDQLGWRSRTALDLDREAGPSRLFRATSEFTSSNELHRERRGEHWQQAAFIAEQLNKRDAIKYSVSVDGYTKPKMAVENYRAGLTFRRNTWRPWFHYEVEPYVLWPRSLGFRTAVGLTLRVETVFGIIK